MNNNGQHNTLNSRQEKFCLNYFSGMSAYQACKEAGYSDATALSHSKRMVENGVIKARLQGLRDKAETDKVMPVTERLERLSEIARARLTDYQESGKDGGWINIGPESPNTAAFQEITSRTDEDKSVITKVKLHSPIQAIDLMNKMEKIYSDGTVVNVDNRQVIFQGVDKETQKLIEELSDGSQEVSGDK